MDPDSCIEMSVKRDPPCLQRRLSCRKPLSMFRLASQKRLAGSRRPHSSFSRRERHVHLHAHAPIFLNPSDLFPRDLVLRLLRGRSANYEPRSVVRYLEYSLIETAESDGPRSYIHSSLNFMLYLLSL